jgi:hypothetical protein
MAATLVYRSCWSKITPLVYSDDSNDDAVNRLIDTIFRAKRTNRLVLDNNKMYYKPSNQYKRFVVRMRKIR